MSGLFASLSSTAGSLQAQQQGLEAVGHNIANVNTPGYARRTVDFVEVAPTDEWSAGGGVAVQGVHSSRDMFVQQRLWRERPQQQESATTASLISVAEAALGAPGKSIDARLGALFDAFDQLAQDPTSGAVRQTVQQQAQALGAEFRQVSSQFSAVEREADQQIRSSIADIKNYADQIAAYNVSIARVGGGATSQGQVITDQLHQTVSQLSEILDVSVVTLEDGQINVSYAGSRALVVGGSVYAPHVTALPVSGQASVTGADGVDVTASLTSGRIGGALKTRDTIVPGYRSQLDTLAATLVQQVNAVHATGFDLNGVAGGNFFAPVASVAGAATAVNLDAAVAADVTKIAAAATPAPGDNQTARTLANLRDARVVGGVSTFAEGWGTLIYQVGQDLTTTETTQKTHADVANQLERLRDSVSGVSIDEEGAMMLKFQRAYQANAKYFQTINQTIDTLLGLLG